MALKTCSEYLLLFISEQLASFALPHVARMNLSFCATLCHCSRIYFKKTIHFSVGSQPWIITLHRALVNIHHQPPSLWQRVVDKYIDLAKSKSGAPVSLFSGRSLCQNFLLDVEQFIEGNLGIINQLCKRLGGGAWSQ